MTPIAIDFETFFSRKLKYGLVQLIPETYCAHELFDCYLISVSDGRNCWSGHPKDFNWRSLEGRVWLSHNRRFDECVYRELVKRGLAPEMANSGYHCTANLTAYLCNRRSLKDGYEFLVGKPISKEYRSVADGKNWPQDYTEAERKQMMDAGRQDACACWELWDKFSPQWPETERKLSNLTITQGMRGVQIDTARLDDYLVWTHEMLKNTEKVIPWISESEDEWSEFNTKPTSTKCISEMCCRVGIPCPPVRSDDEDAFIEWETQNAPNHTWIKAVTAWRSLNKIYKTFITVKERLRPDGTLPFSTRYCGANTRRWSGDSRINFQNMRKQAMLRNADGLLETDSKRVDEAFDSNEKTGAFPEWVTRTIDFRSLIIPRPGKRMIVSDLSQIEPRVLAWMAGDWDFLKRVAAGESCYCAHARASMGFTGDEMDKNSDLYRLAKARVLGLGYGCGAERFIDMAWSLARYDVTKDDPEFIDEADLITGEVTRVSGYGSNSKRIVAEFRAQNPKIVALWKKMGDGFRASIGDDFVVVLPNGGKLRYDKVRASIRMEKDEKTGKPVRKNVYTANMNGRWEIFYGSKLVENAVQSTARDVFAEHVIAMEDRGWNNLFGVHDEAVLETDESVQAADVEGEMSACPKWLAGCPIAAHAKVVDRYCK